MLCKDKELTTTRQDHSREVKTLNVQKTSLRHSKEAQKRIDVTFSNKKNKHK